MNNKKASAIPINPLNKSERINWFPGHMHKSVQKLQQIKKELDLIIEVIDSRAINASSNSELTEIFANKPILKVYLKQDLSTFKPINNELVFNLFHKKTRQIIINAIEQALDWKIKKLQQKGLVQPILQILVCGLPNVGKSSLINTLMQKKIAQTADIPGLTRSFNRFKFHLNMWIYDTPGIFYKTVNSHQIGYQLALIGTIKREVIPLKRTLEFAYTYLSKHYQYMLTNLLKKPSKTNFDTFILELAQVNNFVTKNQEWDLEKSMWYFYDLIRTGKIGALSWDLE